MYKAIILLIFFSLINKNAFSENKFYIVAKVNNEIITNYDVETESNYLKLLNPNLNQLDKNRVIGIAKNSLINEIIKQKQLEKIFEFDQSQKIIDQIFKDFYTNLGFSKEKDFDQVLRNKKTYSILEVKEKIKIDFLWNKLIYNLHNKQIKVDKNKLLNKIKNSDQYKNQYLLSEIFFNKDKNESLENKVNKIKKSIYDVGFNNTASLYSISDTSSVGGKIGWIKEENLSPKILEELYKIRSGEITEIIKIGNNFLILKIEEIKKNKIKIDNEMKLKEMIDFERNRQLNQFSNIYFNKIKINYSIDEK
tara:strand:+ start:147 stop:1070 length:924 start_codon:yes stop_codon:yes gene_type:complete